MRLKPNTVVHTARLCLTTAYCFATTHVLAQPDVCDGATPDVWVQSTAATALLCGGEVQDEQACASFASQMASATPAQQFHVVATMIAALSSTERQWTPPPAFSLYDPRASRMPTQTGTQSAPQLSDAGRNRWLSALHTAVTRSSRNPRRNRGQSMSCFAHGGGPECAPLAPSDAQLNPSASHADGAVPIAFTSAEDPFWLIRITTEWPAIYAGSVRSGFASRDPKPPRNTTVNKRQLFRKPTLRTKARPQRRPILQPKFTSAKP